jgi:O-antigen/teichoic acid export membrane protein
VHPRKSVRDLLGLATSQYVVRVLLMARGLIAARLLGPASYGAWNAIVLLLEYTTQTQLGTLQGLDQAVPPRIVDDDRAGLRRVQRAAMFNILVGGIVFSSLALLYFLRTPGQISGYWGPAGIALALGCAVLINVSSYHTSVLRSHGRIEVVSAWYVIQGLLGAVLGVGLIPWLGAWGLLWGWFAGTLFATLYVRVRGGALTPLEPAPSRESLRLLTVGLPMFVYAGLNLAMRSLDRIIILRFLGTEHLGFYSLAVMAMALLLYLSDSAGYVMYPRLLGRYHAAGGDPESIRRPVQQVVGAVSLVLPACCALAYLVADDSVLWILPRFRDGVPALRILCFGAAALGLGNLAAIVLMVVGRQKLLVPVALGSLALGAAGMLTVIHMGFGIRGVAWVTLATYALHSTVMLWLALGRLHEDRGHRLLTVTRFMVPLAVALPLAWGCNRLLAHDPRISPLSILRLLGAMVAFLAAYVLLMRPLARGVGLSELAADFRLPWIARARPAPGAGDAAS